MEEEMKKDWNYIKDCLMVFEEKTKNRPYFTKEDMEDFQNKMKRSLREKKLKRILNI